MIDDIDVVQVICNIDCKLIPGNGGRQKNFLNNRIMDLCFCPDIAISEKYNNDKALK